MPKASRCRRAPLGAAPHLVRGRWRRRRRCGNNFRTVVHQVFQFLAGFEERDLLCRNFHAVAGFRVSSDARLALARAEAAKPAYFDFVATRSERTTLSKIVSTITSLSLRVSSASRETSSIRSAFVISLFAPFGAGSLYGLRVPEGIAAPVPALRLPITFSNLRASVQVGKRAPGESSQFSVKTQSLF